MFTNLKRLTGGVIIQGFMPAIDIGQKSPEFTDLILVLFQKRKGNIPDNDFTISGWSGYSRGSIPLASHCLSKH